MEKKEWTKGELVDQLKPMFSTCTVEGVATDSLQSSQIDETNMTLVQRLIDSQDKKKQDFPCTPNCGKNCLHSLQINTAGPSTSQVPDCCYGNTNSNKGGNNVTVSQTQDGGRGSVDLAQGPLILNLGNLTNGGVMLMTGQTSNTMQLSIVTNTTNSGQLPTLRSTSTPTTTHNNNFKQNSTAGHVYQSQPCCHCNNSFMAAQPDHNRVMQPPTQHEQSPSQHQCYRVNKNDSGFVTMTSSCHCSVRPQAGFEQSNTHCHQHHTERTGPGIQAAMNINTQSLQSNHHQCCHGSGCHGSTDTINKAMLQQNTTEVKQESMQQNAHQTDSLQQLVEMSPDLFPIQTSVANNETLSSLVDDLNLELMATDTVKETVTGTNCKNGFEHLGDSFESLQASLSSLHGSDLNLDQLDLIDMPEFDKIYHDISNNSNMNIHNSQDSANGQSQLTEAMSLHNNIHGQNIGVLSREASQSRHSLCSHNSTDCGCVTLDNNNVSSSHQNSSESFIHEVPVLPPSRQYHLGAENLNGTTKSSSSPAVITDFSPDWTYTEGQTKVLVTGPWYSTHGTYSVLLDGKVIATTLVQDGVLRCFVPGHHVAYVPLEVSCDGHVISNTVVFEFREKPKPVQDTTQSTADWFSLEDSRLHQQMLEKLDHIESALSQVPDFPHIKQTIASLTVHDQLEMDACLTQHLKSLSTRLWMTNDLSAENGCMGLSLLHLSAALGYSNFIKTLIKWRNENPCWLLEYEVDANSTDHNSCSPLMWACALGHKDAAIILYNWNKGPLHTPNREDNRPLILARQRGHHKLADHLELMDSIEELPHDKFQSESFGSLPATSICNTQTRHSQDGNQAVCSTINSVTSVCSTPDKNFFNSDMPAATSTPIAKDSCENLSIFKSPLVLSENNKSVKSLGELHIEIPSYKHGPSSTQTSRVPARDKFTRRQSDQMLQLSSHNPQTTSIKHNTPSTAAERRQKLKKRLSVDILPYQSSESVPYSPNSFQRPIREANSEPHLSAYDVEHLLCESNPMLSEGRDLGSPEMLIQMDDRHIDQSNTGQEIVGQPITMDTASLKKKWTEFEKLALQPLVSQAVKEKKPPKKREIQLLKRRTNLFQDLNWINLKQQA